MSVLNLTQFAYERRKGCPFRDDKENQYSADPSATTPNKAPTHVTCSIPETPDSLWPTDSVKGRTSKICQQQRRANRLDSTSDEEENDHTRRIGSIFSGVTTCKRRKRVPEEKNDVLRGSNENGEIVDLTGNHEKPEKGNIAPSKDDRFETKAPKSKAGHSKRKLQVFNFGSSDDEEEKISTSRSKRAKTCGFISQRTRTTNGARSSGLHRLCELFPQHSEDYLRCVMEQTEDVSHAVAQIVASDQDHSQTSLGDSPRRPVARRRRKRRCRLLSDDSPCLPAGRRAQCSDIEGDSDGLPSVADTLKGQSKTRSEVCDIMKANERRAARSRWLQTDSQESEEEVLTHGVIQIESSGEEEHASMTAHSSRSSTPATSSSTNSQTSGNGDTSMKAKLRKFAFQPQSKRTTGSKPDSQLGNSNVDQSGTVKNAHCEDQGQTEPPQHDVPMEKSAECGKESKSVIDLEELERNCQEDSAAEYDSDEGYSERQKEAILELLNGCTEEEACNVPRCSISKAKLIMKRRPFESWEHLVDIISSTKSLSEQILDGCLQLLEERRVLTRLLLECQQISTTIWGAVSTLQGAKELSLSLQHNQPSIMNPSLQLKPYQLVGLNWLVLLYSQSLNGILADEMGLGKTVQAIAFLACLYEQGCHGPFLIVVPASTLDNWAKELEVWCPIVRVLLYWGSQEERSNIRCDVLYGEEHYDIILSTYNSCIGQAEDRKFFRKLAVECVVLDEAHMIKNMASQRYNYLMMIKAKRRVLLTGTPLQNNLLELISLLSFVMPDVFQKYSAQLKKTFSRARRMDQSSAYYQEQVSQAKQIMQPFILRRLKSEVLSQLPPKFEYIEYCPLTSLQQQLYSQIVEGSKRDLKGLEAVEREHCKTISVITELRKVANHPLLRRHHYSNERLREMASEILKEPSHKHADPQLVFEDMSVMSDFELHNLCLITQSLSQYSLPVDAIGSSGKLLFLSKKLAELKEKGSRVLLFSQFVMVLDIVEVFLQQERLSYLRLDGKTPISERQQLIDQYNHNDDIFVFLLSTRAGGLGINLTSANVVVLHDIDFNPYNDKQAEDRCHRMGQTREVHVIRLVGKNTIEEEMLHCAQLKLKLEQDITVAEELSNSDVASLLKQGLGLK